MPGTDCIDTNTSNGLREGLPITHPKPAGQLQNDEGESDCLALAGFLPRSSERSDVALDTWVLEKKLL
jgi:hypothetical protein